ncbi:hypothetical protein [Jiulongibacter sediminis]|uniref:Uncharacterized protein n=1 Tax=Jiulongibacter sediminis TaxID=1605367 RepID=A0A0P7BSH7_9BACT|nr:hypothetical protein [Jiulongibacter sediminis]KPM47887.1 hypothetical protein AFM12_11665 [Jiulongibacter sediminis]TBX24070.1 hypothetical protein TK44_11675 [Jiulongibacter sediminis]
MTKSQFFIGAISFARQDKVVSNWFERRDSDETVSLRSIRVDLDRSNENHHIFRIQADYKILKGDFTRKEDLLIEVNLDRRTKKFVETRVKAVEEL